MEARRGMGCNSRHHTPTFLKNPLFITFFYKFAPMPRTNSPHTSPHAIIADFDTKLMAAYYRTMRTAKGVKLAELIIILIIGKNGGGIRIPSLARSLGLTCDVTAYNRVKRMIKKGLLVKPSKGYYCLTDWGASVYSTATGFLQPVLDEIRADVLRSLSPNNE